MKPTSVVVLLMLAGCAGFDGHSLVPGQSTSAEVEKLMGPAADKRVAGNGETVLWYPRMPYGRVSYAARIGKDDRLIAVEQRLTRGNFDSLRPGVARSTDVRDLLVPQQRIDPFKRLEREVWTYYAQGIDPQLIVAQFSSDGILREKYMFNDPEFQNQQSAE